MSTTALASPRLDVAEATDPGRDPKKQVNEDAVGNRVTPFGHLCVVCDGMGGHAGGREASHLAIATIFKTFDEATPDRKPGEVLEAALVAANTAVYTMEVPSEEKNGPRPGSTVVAILVHEDGTEVAHVGDSRAYLVHEGQIFQLTRDHSVVQLMVDAQVLTPHQAAHHPDANKIIRALGLTDDVDVELRSQPVRHASGDVFILCSDGLSDLVEPPEVLETVTGQPGEQAAGKLVALANSRGGHDNITVQIARVLEGAKSGPTMVPKTVIAEAVPMAPAGAVTEVVPAMGPTGTIPPGGPPAAVGDDAPRPGAPVSATPAVPTSGTPLSNAAATAAAAKPAASAPKGAAPAEAPPSNEPASGGRSSTPVTSPSGRPSAAGRPPTHVVAGFALAALGLVIALVMVVLLNQERAGHPSRAGGEPSGIAPAEPVPAPRTNEPTPVQPVVPSPLPPPGAADDDDTPPAPLPSLAPPASAAASGRPRAAPLPRRP